MPPATRIPASRLIEAISNGQYPWWFPPEARDLAIDYFVYGTDFAPIALSATTTRGIQINSDSAFLILSATLVETDTTDLIFFANRAFLANLSTGSGAMNLSNTPIHVDNWFGTAEEPKYWDIPKILLPNSTLNVQLQNLEAVARNVRVAFHGIKIFKYSK